jgi:endonuclease-3
MAKTDWATATQPLIKKYRNRPHPLEYDNLYQLLVMVVLSAQSTDKLINSIKEELFTAFPNIKAMAKVDAEEIIPYITKVRNFRNKAGWLSQIAKAIKTDKGIPATMEGLTALPGIGRKSANVIMRGAGVKAEGVIVDLHVVRVAPRLGITTSEDPKKIEQDIMAVIPQKDWGEIGMAISFLGRETCRPTHPEHGDCVMSKHCAYFLSGKGAKKGKAAPVAGKGRK